MIFFRKDGVFSLDYSNDGSREEIIYSNYELDETPICGVFNDDQSKFIVTTNRDIYLCDRNGDTKPIDIDE